MVSQVKGSTEMNMKNVYYIVWDCGCGFCISTSTSYRAMDDYSLLDELFLSNNSNDGHLCESLPKPINRNSCHLEDYESAMLDSVAGIRMIASLLGLIGACSILISAIVKRRICNSEVHPIFMLSLADCFLSLLWITGSSVWLADSDEKMKNRTLCYVVTTLTGILECVTINLCLLYAIFAYLGIKKTNLNSILMNQYAQKTSKLFVFIVYSIAWLLPAIAVFSMFGITDYFFHFLSSAKECSCWCRPTVVNILPSTHLETNESKQFMKHQLSFVLALSSTISFQYIVVFILLVILYCKILRRIKQIKKDIHNREDLINYGTTAMISQGHNQARKRVLLFLTAFVITGFFNLCSELFLMPFIINLYEQKSMGDTIHVYFGLLFAQSFTLPMQGFVNAIVYGWSRKDFMNVMSSSNNDIEDDDNMYDSEGVQRSFTATINSQVSYDENEEPSIQQENRPLVQ